MSVGFYITIIGLLTRRYIEQTPYPQPLHIFFNKYDTHIIVAMKNDIFFKM
jgi:hypothetical protein